MRLDRSYLAVQGPPGTGKSTTGAAVIAELIRDHGWKVGVVAQSHRTIESLLDKVVEAGTPAGRVLKKDSGGGDHLGTSVSDAELLACATGSGEPGGCLIGGTAWDFVSDKRVPAGSLDLLVIDEAGQFSLADTIAVSRAAPRLLLLGDPQQLPQVSQALHPEPVQRAALAWLADGQDTLPPELGYFLAASYRMRPEVCAVVSHLSYDDRLHSDPCTSRRVLEGIEPGVHTLLVDHQGNRAASNEEADRIVELVDDLLGRPWTDPFDDRRPGPRPLDDTDLVIVAPFNAQVNRLRERLDAAGHAAVPVGTVDKFQGREAPVAIVSMAASAANSSSRGAGFLLSRHRLNVAISPRSTPRTSCTPRSSPTSCRAPRRACCDWAPSSASRRRDGRDEHGRPPGHRRRARSARRASRGEAAAGPSTAWSSPSATWTRSCSPRWRPATRVRDGPRPPSATCCGTWPRCRGPCSRTSRAAPATSCAIPTAPTRRGSGPRRRPRTRPSG
ncbi:DEAD/DEAH box helicase [Aquihabitans daechungensis]|uniref:DEAD/DEAH box helicase n=1 Tax=Aquihabitans daechungensis TaxID=1052257 RepID=UPI003BA180BF